ncbi:MAG TPA: protein kinase, partial [Chroococcales cyanobacterium]
YEFIQRLAAGGMGVVFKAVQKGLDRPVAVKMLHASHMNPLVIRRFQQEAQALARLSHPNLVAVYELGVSDFQQPYMVMEYVDGKPFSALINRKSEIPIAKLLSIFIQICDGLAYIHSKNILHRDLKPSNVMLSDPESGDPKAKLVDFGIAKVIDREDQGSLTETGDVFGSPLYMSPEQAKGTTVDKRTDIYSFGCVMYEALTGAPPFTGSSAVEIVLKQVSERQETLQRAAPLRRFPNGLQRIVDKALEKDVKDRYQSAEELKEDLLELRDKRWYHVRVKLPRAAKGKLARWVALTAAFAILSSAIITWQIVSQKRLQNNVVGLQSGGAMSGAKMDTKADGMVEQGERGSLREGHIDPDASVEGARSTDYDLSNEMVPADEWKLLADPRFRVISSFEADSSNITDEYLNRYVSCLPLTKLLLSETALTSKSIDKIASNFPHLQILKLNNVPLTSADVQSISKLKSLNYISLSGCGLDDACVKSLAKLPALSSVRLDDNANI